MNVLLDEAEVIARCTKLGIAISATEPLPGAGTHLVCTTGADADEARRAFARFLIATRIKRFPFYRVPGSW